VKRFLVLALICFSPKLYADVAGSKIFLGSSAFMLVNLDSTDEPPSFYQLNLGYQLTKKDVLSIELITWKYYAPLGVPYGQVSDKANNFPGRVDAVGVGLAYQRFIWDNIFSAFHATWLRQEYLGTGGAKLSEGEQLFLTLRLGYHFKIGSFAFIEPNLAVTHWPINTGLPASFQAQEDRWGKFQVEPGLHFGFLF
jgi:hypothetical protein